MRKIVWFKKNQWSQIEYPYVNDVKVLKLKRDENTDKNYTAENHFIEKVEITAQTFNTLNAIRGDARDDDFVFNRAQYILIESISASIGTNFNGHEIRNIGTIFKTAIILE